MRKIEQNMVKALKGWQNWQCDNTRVEVFGNEGSRFVFLHNNRIVYIQNTSTGKLRFEFATCDWITRTTISRLHTVASEFNLPVRFCIRNFKRVVSCNGEVVKDAPEPFVFECEQ